MESGTRVVVDDNGKLKQVGDWLMGPTLGKGSFGKVKLAYHYQTNQSVAIKIVDKSSISHVDDVERVYRETFILTTLKHPHIIKLYEVLDTSTSIMLVMEYAGGGDLYQHVNQMVRLSELEACRLFTQIVEGVEYCHRAKVIHRDLKLENILLTSHPSRQSINQSNKQSNHQSNPSETSFLDLDVKIADFGLSNSIKFNQKMDTNCGTPSYTCPEQIAGHPYIGSSADIWSLGVILFSMIAGFLPFEATNIPALFKKISKAVYKAPPYISDEARSLIESMLTIDPDKRATIAELRSHPWMLMEYTELADTIAAMAPVTNEMINESKMECQTYTADIDGPIVQSRQSIKPIDHFNTVQSHEANTSPHDHTSATQREHARRPSVSRISITSRTKTDRERANSSSSNSSSGKAKTSINSGRKRNDSITQSPIQPTSGGTARGHRKSISISLHPNTHSINQSVSPIDKPSTKFPPISSSPQSSDDMSLLMNRSSSQSINQSNNQPNSGSLNSGRRKKPFEESKRTPVSPKSAHISDRSINQSINQPASVPAYMSDTNASRHRLLGKLGPPDS